MAPWKVPGEQDAQTVEAELCALLLLLLLVFTHPTAAAEPQSRRKDNHEYRVYLVPIKEREKERKKQKCGVKHKKTEFANKIPSLQDSFLDISQMNKKNTH